MFIPIGDDIQRRNIPMVPLGLILTNVMVFAHQTRMAMEAAPQSDDVLKGFFETWGLIPHGLADGQVMGLLSHMFVHGDLMHLVGNMIVLWTFAWTLEAGMGSLMLLAFYLFWGLGAGLVHVGMDLGGDQPLIGASGAIAGLMGAYMVAYGPQARIRALFFFCFRPFIIYIPAFLFCLGWIIMQMWHASNDVHGTGGVAWFAHNGGFVIGAVTMFVMRDGTDNALVRDRSGNLVFANRAKFSDHADRDEVENKEESHLPASCPHCRTPVLAENAISPLLARCGNRACERLIYPDRIPVTA